MLAYRMFFRNVPQRIIYRSLASEGSGSKKPPSIAKSESKITNLKDKISLFLRPRKTDSSKTSKSSAASSKSVKIAPNTSGLSQESQSAPNTTSGSVPNSSKSPNISSSSFTKTTTAPKKEDAKAPNQPTSKPDVTKIPSKPPKTKPVPKSDDIGLKSPSIFPAKCDDRNATASKTENVKLTGSGSTKDPEPKDKQETCPPKKPPNPEKNCPDAKPKCGTQDPPKPCLTEYERTPCKSNTRESCPPPPCPPEPCKTKDASPRCSPKEPPKASKTEDTTCPPKELCKTDHTRTPCKSNTRESCPPPPDVPKPCKPEDTKPQCPPKHPKPGKTEGPKGPATSCKTEDIEKVCPAKDTLKICKEKEERPACPPNDPAESCKSGDVQKICQSEEIRSFCQNDLHPISRDVVNKTYTDHTQSPVVIGMDRCVKENTPDKSNIVCRTIDKNLWLPPEIEKELISDDCKDRKTMGPLKMKTACPPQQTSLTKGAVRRGDIRETAKPVGQISKEEAIDSCYQRDQTCLEYALNDAACETKVPCQTEEVCQPAPPTPPCECPDCPEIAKLEYLNEPCHTDPDDILLPKEEVQKRRCFKCSTVQENTWIDLSATTGVPAEQLKERTAIIAKAFKNVMQQGTDNAKEWEVQWDTKERWQNPLVGWASSADPLGNVKLSFATQLDAERWCTRNGWKYVVLPERAAAPLPPKSYSDNFSWNRRYRVSTK